MEDNTQGTPLTSSANANANPNKLPAMEVTLQWQKVAYWSIFPAVLIVPPFFALGRSIFGAGGWEAIATIILAFFIILPYQLLLMVLALFGTRGYLSKRTSVVLFTYYILMIINQLTLYGGGDSEDSFGSVMTRIGLPEFLNTAIFYISFLTGIGVMVCLAVILALDMVKARTKKIVVNPDGSFGA